MPARGCVRSVFAVFSLHRNRSIARGENGRRSTYSEAALTERLARIAQTNSWNSAATFPPTVSPVPTVSPMPTVSLLPAVNITEVAQEVIEKPKPNRETDPACRVWFLRGSCVRAYPEEQPVSSERNFGIVGIGASSTFILAILWLSVQLPREKRDLLVQCGVCLAGVTVVLCIGIAAVQEVRERTLAIRPFQS